MFSSISLPSIATLFRVVQILFGLIIFRTALAVWMNYPDYFPPNFRADFLLGRQDYFFGAYQWAFYAHILVGPLTLITGLLLMSDRPRQRLPQWHRTLGRVQVALILLLLTPSGLWMAWYAATGAVAAVGFATLAIVTAIAAAMGWRCAVQRRFAGHRRWMWRCYALLCSAVVLRVIGGLSDYFGAEWTYSYAAWISWLLPLIGLEVWLRFQEQRFPSRSTIPAKLFELIRSRSLPHGHPDRRPE